MVTPSTLLLVVLSSLAAPARASAPPPPLDQVVHVPPTRTAAGQPLTVTVDVADISATGPILLYWRIIGEDQWSSLVFERDGDAYTTAIPGRTIHLPGVEYVIASKRGDARATPRFATFERPHRVYVAGETNASRERRLLAQYGGHRSTVRLYGGAASYGTLPGHADDIQRDLGASFTYRTLTNLHALEFRFDRTRAETPADSPTLTQAGVEPTGNQYEAGYDRGSAAAHFALHDVFGVRLGASLGVDLDGFTAGGGVGLRFGTAAGTRVWAFFDGVAGVGQTAGLSLTWDTVPNVPMTAGVDITTWPAGVEWATRLRYGASVPLGDQLGLDLEASYQARSALAGGFGGRGGLSWSF